MKTVFTNQELFHVFASGTQEHGRSANGNVFFSGNVLYSYGTHFPLAVRYNGKMLLNADSYSVTTSKHKSYAARALRHFDCVYLPALRVVAELVQRKQRAAAYGKGQAGKEARQVAMQDIAREARSYVKGMAREIENAREKLSRARAEHMRNHWQREIARHERAAAFVWHEIAGKRSNPIAGAIKAERNAIKARLQGAVAFDLEQFTRENKEAIARNRLAELRSMQERLQNDEDEEYAAIRVRTACESVQSELCRKRVSINAGNRDFLTKATQERLQAAYAIADSIWQEYFAEIHKEACATVQRFKDMEYAERVQKFHAREVHAIGTGDTVCRVHGDTVETSRGAKVPLDAAVKLFNAARMCRLHGKATKTAGNRIGRYRLDGIDSQGNATIGCHYLTWQAIEDCAARYMPELVAPIAVAAE
jgi:hypothetical protein